MLNKVLTNMQKTGFGVKKDLLFAMKKDSRKTLQELGNIFHYQDAELDPGSTEKLRKALFKKLHLPPGPTTTKKTPKVNNDILEVYRREGVPLAGCLIKYRRARSILTSCKNLKESLDQDDRAHPTYSLNSVTGRAYTQSPDIQKLPKKMRKVVVPGEGNLLVSADYSQIDVRVIAHFSQDKSLIRGLRCGDIYTEMAKQLGTTRDTAKQIFLSILYGMGKRRLSNKLCVSQGEAQEHIDKFYKKHEGVKKFIDAVTKKAEKRGYVLSLAGRKIPVEKGAEVRKEAVARMIQACTADVVLRAALVELFNFLHAEPANIVLQVHDELVVEAPAESVQEVKDKMKQVMENAWDLKVPLQVKANITDNWQ